MVIIFKIERHQRKLMRKVTVHLLLAAVLLGAVISKSHAATDTSGNNATATTPPDKTVNTLGSETGTTSDTLPPEPGTTSDAKTDTAGDSSEEANRKRLEAKVQAAAAKAEKAEKAKSDASKSIAVQHSEFWGKYFGVKFGIVNSSASGAIDAPSASTLAYGVQGGYLQAGYNWDLYAIVVGLGAYYDVNNYSIHSNNVGYSSRAYGLDTKLGLPVDDWLPYIKLGYGRSMGTSNSNLGSVSQYGRNAAVGVEYNVAPRWSVIAELKRDSFSNRDKSITINNRLFTFGFNYYIDKPLPSETVKAAPEIDLAIPEPILQPDAVPEDAPPP